MQTSRSAPVATSNAAAVCIVIMKRLDSVDHNLRPTEAQARLDALTGFRYKDRLSYNAWIARVTTTPGLLFGGVYVVTFPNDVYADAFVDATLLPNTIGLSSLRFYADSETEFDNLLGACAMRKTGEYIGGIYDPETGSGLVGGSLPVLWP